MQHWIKRILFFTGFFFIAQAVFAVNLFKCLVPPKDIYIALSGGYGKSEQAYENTGANSLIRIGFGSLWGNNKKTMLVGSELGFQTGNQIRLIESVTEGESSGVPIYLNSKTPVDFLLVTKWVFYKPFFVQAKGGAAFIATEVTGGDIQTNNNWVPDLQLGLGMGLSTHSRLVLSYQKFFGKPIVITPLEPLLGTSVLTGIPTWRAFLFTIEVKV